ncbi:MAG: S9 family peptidase [Acidobacteriota bacterium]
MRASFLFLLSITTLVAQKKPITLEALQEIAQLPSSGAPGNPLAWAPDGTRFVYRQGTRLIIYNAAERTSKELLDTAPLSKAATDSIEHETEPFQWENRRVTESNLQWSSAEDALLYSTGGDLFWIQIASGEWKQLTRTPDPERDPKLSPDGKTVAFRREWDLYTLDISSAKERRLTRGGSSTLRNAGLDWVYPEELDLSTAYWWSPDSATIAYLQFDTSHEPLHPHADYKGPRPLYEPERYPYAGENNPDVRLGVVSANGGGTKWFDTGNTRFDYLIARVTWTPDSQKLFVLRPNRVQSRIELLAFDVRTRKASPILEEADLYWVNLSGEPQFIKNGSQFLWLSERDGFRHIYLYSADGKLIRQLTSGPWEVTSIDAVEETSGLVYYTSSEPSPLERHLYTIGLDGQPKHQLTTEAGTHSINLGPHAKYYLHTFSSISAPARVTLHSGDGREVGVYRETDRRVLDQYNVLPTELSSFRTPDGAQLYTRLIRPAAFDPARKYPAVVLVYGGPGAQGIRNSWPATDIDQVLANAGFVVWQVDNRGSTGRGHAFEIPIFRNLGPVELADQIAGVQHLVSLGFVDPARVGVRGWSYGGFMTLNAMLNAPDTFKAGIAGAPVTSWLNYDTIYTERYMDVPKSNPEGYKNTALPAKARNLKGALMIMHNIEDDNVLFPNTLQMIDALERAGKQFDLVLYTQKAHGVTGPEAQHVNAAILKFFERNLQ